MSQTATRAAVYGRESQDNTKSIEDQVAIGADVITEHGWTHTGSYDDGTSASRYATKARPGWERLVADLDAGSFDVLILWETTRGSREPVGWFTLLNLCRDRGVRIHVVSDERTFDPRRARDYKDLASAGVDGTYETDRTSERVQRGHLAAAKSGRPPMGKAPYGYRRTHGFDPDRRRPVMTGQEPNPDTAPVVRRIFEQIAASVPLSAVVKRLNADGVPPPRNPTDTRAGRVWGRARVREIAANVAYAGLRVHRRQGRNANGAPQTFPGGWEPIVGEEQFWTVQRILSNPDRTTTRRPGRQAHLLTFLAVCYRGHPLTSRADRYYVCQPGCVLVVKAALDDLVEATVVEALADPKVYRRLRQAGELSDREAQATRNELAKLTARLGQWRRSAARGETTPASLAEIEAELSAQIGQATRRADQAALPPALRPFVEPGVDVEARWDAATLSARRDVIRALMTIRVQPTGQRPRVPVAERVDITPRT